MEPKPSHQRSTDFVMAGLGATLVVAGLLFCAFMYVALKNDHSEFGGLGEGLMIVCGGLPLLLTGLVILLIGLVMPVTKRKRDTN